MPPALPPADPGPGAPAGLWPRTVAWLVDAALLACGVGLALGVLPGSRWPVLADQWRALGTTLGRAMAEAAARGEDPLRMLASLCAAEGPLRPAIHAFAAALHLASWPPLLGFVLLATLLWPLQESGTKCATPGKRLLGLEARAADGARLSWPRALARHLAGTLSWLSLNIGHLLAASAPAHHALHDQIARTRVVWRDRPRAVPAWGWLLLVAAIALPLLIALLAAATLAAAMQAALPA